MKFEFSYHCDTMRGQWLVTVSLLLFAFTRSSPTSEDKDTDDIREREQLRHRRQVPSFDPGNRDGINGISVPQRQPEGSVDQTTTESVQEEVFTTVPTEDSTSTIASTEKNYDPMPLYPFHVADSDDLPLHLIKANCDFGEGLNVDLCNWKNVPRTLEKWIPSKGTNFGLLGGPKEDQTNLDDRGGYALFDTKNKEETPFSQSLISDAAMLISPILAKTDGAGICVDFWYAMEGLSQGKLRILLRPPSPLLFGPVGHEALSDEEFLQKMLSSDGKGDIVLWEHKDSTEGQWINGQVVYALHDRHMLIFEGLPVPDSDPKHAYRGYISLDDIKFMDGSVCKPFCNFEGGFCSWSQDSNDDFDWSIGRGTLNPSTGPIMDNFSLKYSRFGITGGAYAYIDSSYPHRSSHKARLLSEIFSPPSPNAPLCMRFWTHMFGNGIGALRIIVAPTQGEEEIIWNLKGEQGNNWYQGQVTISSLTDFQIAIEAEIGGSNLGDIAIDEIALKEGACPTSPQSASKFKVDCTFEVDECGWRNIEPRVRVDELDWERTLASLARLPNSDHTLKTQSGTFISLPRNSIQRGERGWLVSTPLESPNIPLCLSFWYYLFDPLIETSQPSLGGLMVILMEQDNDGTQTMIPIWRLTNSQGPDWQHGHTSLKSDKSFMILFEGLWGTSKGSEYIALDDITLFTGDCDNKPEEASVSFLDCDFTRDSCSYTNSSTEQSVQWIRSSISRRPALLNDHTYGPPPGGYIYFDVFRNNQNNDNPVKVSLTSRVIEARSDREPFCLTFWYAVSSFDDTTQLSVNRESVDASSNDAEAPPREGSSLRIWNVEARKVATNRPEWLLGQTQVSANSDFKISFVGETKVGGFAIDDILVYPGTCRTYPAFEDNGFNK